VALLGDRAAFQKRRARNKHQCSCSSTQSRAQSRLLLYAASSVHANANHATGPLLLTCLFLAAAPPPAHAQVPEQCKNSTLSYDISFVGPVKYIQVGASRVGSCCAGAGSCPTCRICSVDRHHYIRRVCTRTQQARNKHTMRAQYAQVLSPMDTTALAPCGPASRRPT